MKVIDILNKIANGEEAPKKIKYCGKEYAYKVKDNEYVTTKKPYDVLGLAITWSYHLNDEVELLEEEIDIENIEQILELTHYDEYDEQGNILACKINELIKAVKQIDRKQKNIIKE